jgi:hypothetical protein
VQRALYEYDHYDRLIGVYYDNSESRGTSFTHDALGRRIEFADDVNSLNRYYPAVDTTHAAQQQGREARGFRLLIPGTPY